MILGLDRHPAAHCFVELDDAITALRPPGAPPVALNAHAFPNEIPEGAIVMNTENVGVQVSPLAFDGHEVWDFSARNVTRWMRAVKHVPIGWHPTMKRFEMRPWADRDIDVVMTGCLNDRRAKILTELAEAGLNVALIGPGKVYGAERDAVLARSKMALNVLFYADGVSPALRSAHCAANGLPCISEHAPEKPLWDLMACHYDGIVECVRDLIDQPGFLDGLASGSLNALRARPMQLPEAR